MTNSKFTIKRLTMLQDIEDQFIKLIGDNQESLTKKDKESWGTVLKKFVELVQTTTKFKVHGRIVTIDPYHIAFETSKYAGECNYKDHTLWVFIRHSDSRYDITLNRYSYDNNR